MAATASASFGYLIIPPLRKHTATVIFAHGLGESGHVWKSFAQQLQWSTTTLQHTKWILIHAPKRLVTVDYKIAMMPSWFSGDTTELTPEAESQLLYNIKALNNLIEAEMVNSGLSSERIFLGGFGQGGMVALGTGLTLEKKLGGVIALSATLPLRYQLKEMLSPYAREIPVFWSYGAEQVESLMNAGSARQNVEFLNNLGFIITTGPADDPKGIFFHVYRGLGHATDKEEVEDLTKWLESKLCTKSHRYERL